MSQAVHPQDLSVILVEPSHPGNVGAVARAMSNMGLSDLRLVGPALCQHETAMERAAHGVQVLKDANAYDTVEAAIADLHWVGGTTARVRSRQDRTTDLPNLISVLPGKGQRLGFMFGRESSGLTNQELSLCSTLIHIPTFGEASSLNLSHAVMVTLYEISRNFQTTPQGTRLQEEDMPASLAKMDGLLSHLESVLTQTGFLKTHQETGVMERFSDFFARARPSERDVQMWRGMLHRVQVTQRRLETPSQSDIPPSGTPDQD